MSIDTSVFKKAMGHFPTGVTITTAYDKAGHVAGMTASAFCSVSIEPLLVLMCPAKDAECYPALTEASYFSIHLLGADQAELAWQFAKSGVDKSQGIEWAQGAFGAPKIPGTLAYLECRHHAVYDGGDHGILVGEVVDMMLDEEQTPLAYCKSQLGPMPAL